jgi:hypothetical protein
MERPIKELLTILLEHISQDGFVLGWGLCPEAHNLYVQGVFRKKEAALIKRFILANMPAWGGFFGWPIGQLQPRIDFLKEQIEKL